MKHTVLLPIEVPDSKYCWAKEGEWELCKYYDNTGGYSSCDLNLGSPKYTYDGVEKPEGCLKLKTMEEK